MAVPTSYTYETFADYLKNEVFRDSAEGIGFEDYVPEIPQITARIVIRASGTPPYNFTTGIPIYQPGFSKAAGASLVWSNGVTRTLDAAITPTSTTMNIAGLGGGFNPGDYSTVILRAAVARVRNQIYDIVADEAIAQMGLSGIGDVDSTNIKLFRQMGRVELLRKAMQNVATRYNYTTPIGGPATQQDVYTQVVSMYQREQLRLNALLREGNSPTASIPEESNSESRDVALVW